MKVIAKEGVTVRITIEPGKYIFVAGEPVGIDENNENVMSQVRWLLDSGMVKRVEEREEQVKEEVKVEEKEKKEEAKPSKRRK